jgi:hypothetical protein
VTAGARPPRMPVVIILAAGLVLGFAVGRWWALTGAVALGVWAGTVSELEVPAWFIGLVYAGLAAIGIAAGVLGRRLVSR